MSFGQPPPPSQWISPAVRTSLRAYAIVKIPRGASVRQDGALVRLLEDGWAILLADVGFRQLTSDGWGGFRRLSEDVGYGCEEYIPLRMVTGALAEPESLEVGDVVCDSPGLVVKAYGLPSVVPAAAKAEAGGSGPMIFLFMVGGLVALAVAAYRK